MPQVSFDITEYIYHSTAITIYISIAVVALAGAVGFLVVKVFRSKTDKRLQQELQKMMDSTMAKSGAPREGLEQMPLTGA
eukprot:SAG31_NODE_133_length_23315_cov_4.858847_12_plen_80_part_00